ncbi:MAG TPA: GNAT family N-acetyltransferase [Solirubrobacteraceae bacterium]|nr:GNAT family N-acetyltransferase [Solirubrobacteraceae bacterium]
MREFGLNHLVTIDGVWDGLWVALEGELVALEPLRHDHADQLFDASRDPEIWRWLPIAAPTREELEVWVAQSVAEGEAGREAPYATVWRRSGRAVGSTRYLTLRPEHRGLEIGWTWLQSAAWQTGANVEAKLLMLEHAFEHLGCQRVEFKTDGRNARSRAALAALPAEFEGVLRRHMDMPYGPRDSAYYSVVGEEWPAVRARLEERLSAKVASA